jgi:D-arabinose 1-dehydrogenase-like Zn-dependent alcohol dehydrogenase
VSHSDIYTAKNDWKGTKYPVVPGHEIIGRVVEIGTDVHSHKVGDLVGAGVTTWSPLTHWKVKKGDKVGVVGLGGLGHMGVKFF